MSIYAHIIKMDGKLLSKVLVEQVPRSGDELRLSEGNYYIVEQVVWVFDEPNCPHQRVNIGVEEIKDGS